MHERRYWTYILTNWNKTVLYTGITNNLPLRLIEHWIGIEGCFTSRYKVYYLVWTEETKYVMNAIDLEKKLKDSSREHKQELIHEVNPVMLFLNSDVIGNWPPTDLQMQKVQERWRMERDGLIDDPTFFSTSAASGR